MRFRQFPPDPRLQGHLQGYWEVEDLHLAGPEQNAELPERTMRLMFSAGDTWLGRDLGSLHRVPPVMLTSFSTQPQRSVVRGPVRALAADLYPWGARQLLGWRAQEAPEALDARLSETGWGREVVALLKLGDWDAARERLEEQLLRLALQHGEPGTGLQAAQQIYRSLGTVRVSELAESLNLSPRSLERQFQQQVGVGPKTLARVVRFDELLTRIRRDPQVAVADLTFELGFFDQAHLIKEFKTLSSMTPGSFAAFAASRLARASLLPGEHQHEQRELDRRPAERAFHFR